MIRGRSSTYNSRKTEDPRLLFVIHVLQTYQAKFGEEKYSEAIKKMIATIVEYSKKETQLKRHNDAKEEQKKFFNAAQFLSFLIELQEKYRLIILDKILKMAADSRLYEEEVYKDKIRKFERIARKIWDEIKQSQIKEKIIKEFLAFIALEKQKIETYLAKLAKERVWLVSMIDKYNKIIDHLRQEMPNRIINFLSSVQDIPGLSDADRIELASARREFINAVNQLSDNFNQETIDNFRSSASYYKETYTQKCSTVPDAQEAIATFDSNYKRYEINKLGRLLSDSQAAKTEYQQGLTRVDRDISNMQESQERLSAIERNSNYDYQNINLITSGPRNAIDEADLRIDTLHEKGINFFNSYNVILSNLSNSSPELKEISALSTRQIDMSHHAEEKKTHTEEKELHAQEEKLHAQEEKLHIKEKIFDTNEKNNSLVGQDINLEDQKSIGASSKNSEEIDNFLDQDNDDNTDEFKNDSTRFNF